MTAPYASLQHTEAMARFDLLTVRAYDVRLDLTGAETFSSVTTIRLTSRGGATFLDLKPVALHRISLDGVTLDPARLDRGRYPLDLPAGEHELVVEATMPFRNDGEGLHLHVDPADGRRYVYGMAFMDAAPTIFACFDQPDLKAPYTFHVRAPEDWVVIGNAPATNQEPGAWELEETQPLSTYFVTLVAGPYHVIEDEHDGIPLGLSARASLAGALEADAEDLLTVTKQSFDELHRLFGIRYAFGKYHQAFVPEFNAGAMENPGCVTFRDTLLFTSRVTRGRRIDRASTVAHEMAHQWFGNLVTPKWWDDLWLNESFAEYLGTRVTGAVTQYDDVWAENSYARRLWGLTADLGPGTHPVAGNGAVDATAALQDFDGISYAKGASILKQLNASLGDEVFLRGAVDHFERHRFGNATMHDLLASWEKAGAANLADVSEQWLRTSGADTLELDRAAGVIRRTPPAGAPADRTHSFRVAVARGGRWEAVPVTLTGAETPFDAGDAPVILDGWEDTWSVNVLDRSTLSALPDLLPEVTDDALRASIWNDVRGALHLGVLDPADAVELAVASLPVEDTEDTPVRANPRHTIPWLFQILLPLAPAGSLERIHDAALAKLTTTSRGSEHQLTAFRVAISSATDPVALRAWLKRTPEGIDPDLDLRWRILNRLAALGATDRAELDAALTDRATADAQVEHARATASLPDAEAKAFAWARLTGEAPASNYEVEAVGLAMWQPGQEDLTAAYVERYFDLLPTLPEAHSGWVLGVATESFFPVTSLDRRTVEKAEQVLADAALDPTVRRRLSEAADRLRRMVAVREKYSR